MTLRKEDIEKVMRSGGRPEDEILKLVQAHGNKHLPSILRVVGGNRAEMSALFNSLTFAFVQGSEDNSILTTSLDDSSLMRLAAAAGGRTIRIPTVEEIVHSHLVVLALYAVRVKSINKYKVLGCINHTLTSLELTPLSLTDLNNELKKCTASVLKGLLKKNRQGDSDPVIVKLQDSLVSLESMAQDLQVEIESKTDDVDHLVTIYEKLRNSIDSIDKVLQWVMTNQR